MNQNPLKNIILWIVALVCSYFTASYVGEWYDGISYQYGSWIAGRDLTVPFAGGVLSYLFFNPFMFGLFGVRKNKNSIIWLSLPVLLLAISSDENHLYIPIAFVAVGLVLAWLVRKVIAKFRHHNLPMVINK